MALVVGCAQMAHHDEHFIAFDQTFGIGHGFGGLIHVVIRHQFDFAAVHTTGLVDTVEHCFHASFDIHAPVGHGTRQIESCTNDHLGVGDTVFGPDR